MGTTRAETVHGAIVIPPVASGGSSIRGRDATGLAPFEGNQTTTLSAGGLSISGHPAERAAAKTSGPGSNGEGGGGGTFGRRPRGFLTGAACFGGTSPHTKKRSPANAPCRNSVTSVLAPLALSRTGCHQGAPGRAQVMLSQFVTRINPHFPSLSVTRDMSGLCTR